MALVSRRMFLEIISPFLERSFTDDVICANGYFEASELCPQFEKNSIACFLITLEQSNRNL